MGETYGLRTFDMVVNGDALLVHDYNEWGDGDWIEAEPALAMIASLREQLAAARREIERLEQWREQTTRDMQTAGDKLAAAERLIHRLRDHTDPTVLALLDSELQQFSREAAEGGDDG